MLRTLDRQRLAHKLLLVALLALLMLAVPGALTLQDHLGELRLAHERQTGLAPASAVLDLVRQTQKHRGMSAGALAGSATLETQRQALAKELEKSQQTLQERLASLGLPALQQQARQRRDDWQALQDAVAARKLEGPQSFARHTALIAGQLELLDDVALATGLARDTDPVDHALESLALGALPALSEGLGQARARGSALLAKGSASADELARFDDLVNRVARDRHQVERVLARLDGLDPALVAGLAEARKPAVAALEQARGLIDEKIVKAQTFSHPAPEYFASMTQVIDRLFVLADAVFARHQQRLQAEAAAARNDLLALAGGLLALGGLAGWLMWHVTRSTTRSLNQAVQIARAVAEGRLGDAADHRGATRAGAGAAANDHSEVTQLMVALDDMATRLTEVVSGVRRSADGVAQASREIAQGNMDLSNRTEQQAAALEQTAATMDELGSTVRHNAENAGQAAQLAQGAREVAQRGSTAVHEVITTMKAIADSARQIERINGTIDGIAFQTNILALNASVEAARAGEQGRGFAVVAGEVRHLAQRAAEAAREIKQLIATSQESVDQGSRQVDEAGATMTEVVQAIHHVSDIVEEISQASREQSTGVQQVGQAVTQMDQTTQQNAALVEEGAAAAGSLESQARQLAEMVSVFDLARHGVAG